MTRFPSFWSLSGHCLYWLLTSAAYVSLYSCSFAAANRIPFLDTSRRVVSSLTLQDIAAIGLVLISTAWLMSGGAKRPASRAERLVSRAGVVLLAWWVWTLLRTVVGEHVSVLHSVHFGRDFLYFATLLIVLPRVVLTHRDIELLLKTLFLGAVLFALGQIITDTGLSHLGGVIHYNATAAAGGLTRLYAPMTDFVNVGAALSGSGGGATCCGVREWNLMASAAAVVFVVAVVVQLTRARWVGLSVALILVTTLLMSQQRTSIGQALRRRVVVGLTIGVLALVGVVITHADFGGGGAIGQRAFLALQDIESGGGTVGVRETAAATSLKFLGGQWPVGLGFVSPSDHYFPGLTDGSIRDSDLGVLNAVMTMGVIGALLLYAPLLIALSASLRGVASWSPRYAWLRYGVSTWFVAALVSSLTLVTLFSVSGLVLTAGMISIAMQPIVRSGQEPAAPLSLAEIHSDPPVQFAAVAR